MRDQTSCMTHCLGDEVQPCKRPMHIASIEGHAQCTCPRSTASVHNAESVLYHSYTKSCCMYALSVGVLVTMSECYSMTSLFAPITIDSSHIPYSVDLYLEGFDCVSVAAAFGCPSGCTHWWSSPWYFWPTAKRFIRNTHQIYYSLCRSCLLMAGDASDAHANADVPLMCCIASHCRSSSVYILGICRMHAGEGGWTWGWLLSQILVRM